jgi:hypothetical protein
MGWNIGKESSHNSREAGVSLILTRLEKEGYPALRMQCQNTGTTLYASLGLRAAT